MHRGVLLSHWRTGLLCGLGATVIVLILATARSPRFAGVVDGLVLPQRVDVPKQGPFARQPVTSAELRAHFDAFVQGDGLRQFLRQQNGLGSSGGALSQDYVDQYRGRVSLEPLDATGKVRLRVEDTRPRKAAVSAEKLALSFKTYLEDRERERRRVELEDCRAKVTAAESKLNILRQAILSFRRMHLEAVEKYGGEKREDWRQALFLDQLNARIGSLEERLKALSGLEPDEFLKTANRWKLIDQGLSELATHYIDNGSTVRALDTSGLSKDHVEVVASRGRFEDARKRLEGGISRFLEKMREEERQEKERRAALLAERDETWSLLGEIGKRLEETKEIYESESSALAQLQAKLYAAQLESSLPVLVMDAGEQNSARLELRGPSLVVDVVLAPLMGVLCGLLAVQVQAWRVASRKAARDRELAAAAGAGEGGYAVAI